MGNGAWWCSRRESETLIRRRLLRVKLSRGNEEVLPSMTQLRVSSEFSTLGEHHQCNCSKRQTAIVVVDVVHSEASAFEFAQKSGGCENFISFYTTDLSPVHTSQKWGVWQAIQIE